MANSLGYGATLAGAEFPARLDVGMEDGAGGVCEPAFGCAVRDFFEVTGDASEGTACAGGADKAVDAARELGPDFGSRGFDVCETVGGVVELVGPDGVGDACSMRGGLVVVVFGVLEGDYVGGGVGGELLIRRQQE